MPLSNQNRRTQKMPTIKTIFTLLLFTLTLHANIPLLTTTDPLGNTETTEYNAKNSPTSISDKNGNTMSIVYDSYNAPQSFTTASGATNTFTYDNFGNKLSATNEYGQTTNYTYDSVHVPFFGTVSSKGNILKETQPNGTTIEHSYDDRSNLLTTKTTTVEGSVTTTSNTYDQYDRLITSTDERGNISRNEYDARGNKVSTTDGQNRTTTYTYSPSNKVIKTEYPDGTSDSKTYDAMDNLLSETNTEGETTSYEYDKADRLIKTTYADGSTTSSEYDDAGRVISTTDQNGNTTSYEYDEAGNKVATVDALNNRTTYSYDANGNMLTMTDALGQTTTYEYNKLNQRVKTIYPDGTVEQSINNSSGLPIKKIDENGNETTYGYDTSKSVPLLNSVTLPNQEITHYEYDAQGRKTAQTDALSHTTSYSYNQYGQIKSETLPLGQTKTFTYDSYGKQTQINDYASKATKFIYDSNDRLVTIEYVDGTTTTYGYTPSGQVQTITNGEGTITNSYDSMGRLKSQTNTKDETITYSYDGVGNIVEMVTPTQTITKTYTKRNQLESVTDNQGTTSYEYDALDRQTQITYPNGTTTNYNYDSRSRVTSIEHKDNNGAILQSFAYTLDNIGNRLKVVQDNNRTVEYSYNNVNQLTIEKVTHDPKGNNTTTEYHYDAVGNLLAKTIDGLTTNYEYNANDQLTNQDGEQSTYDDNGNLIAKGDTTYSYNAKNQLIKVTTPTNTIEYSYDAQNNRITKSINNQTTHYLIDNNTNYAKVLHESSDTESISYTYGNDLISHTTNSSAYYYHTDALGSTRSLTNSSATLEESYNYTPYGKLLDSNTTKTSYLYTGEKLDTESDNYYLRARYYSPSSSRFLSRDTYDGTANSPLSQNHYLYGNGNPVMFVDLSGNMSMINTTTLITGMGILATRVISMAPTIARGAISSGLKNIAKLLSQTASKEGGEVGLGEQYFMLTLAKLYARTVASKNYKSPMLPIQVYGNNLIEHKEHIYDSMIGVRENIQGHKTAGYKITSALLTRVGNDVNDRKFLTKECGGYPRTKSANGGNQHCDEYPYSSTLQGGTDNYELGLVSTRLVSAEESSLQGQFIKKFYRNAPVSIGKDFMVIPLGIQSGFFDEYGFWYKF